MLTRPLHAALLFILIAQGTDNSLASTSGIPKRLVSTDAAATEILLLLGAGDRLVAVDASSQLPEGKALPRLGYHRALSAEGVISLAPELVIGSEHMGPPHVLDSLKRADVPVMKLNSPTNLEALAANIELIANATGSGCGDSLVNQLRLNGRRLAEQALPGQRAAFVLRAEGGKLRLAGDGTAGAGFIGLLGADNVAEHANYRSISPEALMALTPDLLLLADTEDTGSAEFLARYPVLRFSPAVRGHRLFTVDASSLVAGISIAAVAEAARIQQAANTQLARKAD
jgi:iron complex transport system substrate-binding protein